MNQLLGFHSCSQVLTGPFLICSVVKVCIWNIRPIKTGPVVSSDTPPKTTPNSQIQKLSPHIRHFPPQGVKSKLQVGTWLSGAGPASVTGKASHSLMELKLFPSQL